jgi:hypothetical protein
MKIIQRKKQYQQLCEAYESSQNSLVILSGRYGVGKTTLVREFAKGKTAYFYQASECSDREQRKLLCTSWQHLYSLDTEEWKEHDGEETFPGYLPIFQAICHQTAEKTVIILEDFPWIAKNDPSIYEDIVSLLREETNIMLILTVSTLTWREEEAKIEPRSFVSQITDRIILEPFSFLELVKYFPGTSMEEIIQIYALLGGIPGYLRFWDTGETVKENILRLFIRKDALLEEEAVHYMRMNLRELALYNTVLCALTRGVTRLNDMHMETGFSRAKISVYMKNLKQLGIVGKSDTLGIKCHDQELKGMYEITDPLVHFWYRFVYPYQTLRDMEEPEDFYDRIIASDLEEYTAFYFEKVCGQYIELMNLYQKLPVQYDISGSWYGKDGRIPLLAKDRDGQLLVVYSKWSRERFSAKDLEEILQYLIMAGIEPEYYFLFSRSDFDSDVTKKVSFVKNINLVALKDM